MVCQKTLRKKHCRVGAADTDNGWQEELLANSPTRSHCHPPTQRLRGRRFCVAAAPAIQRMRGGALAGDDAARLLHCGPILAVGTRRVVSHGTARHRHRWHVRHICGGASSSREPRELKVTTSCTSHFCQHAHVGSSACSGTWAPCGRIFACSAHCLCSQILPLLRQGARESQGVESNGPLPAATRSRRLQR